MALIGSLNSGISAIRSFTQGIEVIGTNIANVNTVGYKSARTEFSDLFSSTIRRSSPSDGTGNGSNQASLQIGSGVQVQAVGSNFNQGPLEPTGQKTNIAVIGEGFFTVVDSVNNRDYITRAGNFRMDDNGYIVTPDGFRLQGLTGGTSLVAPAAIGDLRYDITYTPPNPGDPELSDFAIDETGRLNYILTDGSSFTAGQVLLHRFTDPQALVKEGNGLFTGTDAAGPVGGATLNAANHTPGTNGLGTMRSGFIEMSNVDLTTEFANVITTQRSFQAGSRIITVSDEMLQEIVNLKR